MSNHDLIVFVLGWLGGWLGIEWNEQPEHDRMCRASLLRECGLQISLDTEAD